MKKPRNFFDSKKKKWIYSSYYEDDTVWVFYFYLQSIYGINNFYTAIFYWNGKLCFFFSLEDIDLCLNIRFSFWKVSFFSVHFTVSTHSLKTKKLCFWGLMLVVPQFVWENSRFMKSVRNLLGEESDLSDYQTKISMIKDFHDYFVICAKKPLLKSSSPLFSFSWFFSLSLSSFLCLLMGFPTYASTCKVLWQRFRFFFSLLGASFSSHGEKNSTKVNINDSFDVHWMFIIY